MKDFMRDFMKDLAKSPLAIVGLFWICVAVLIALTINFPVQVIVFLQWWDSGYP